MIVTRKIKRALTSTEDAALQAAKDILEEAFGKKMFAVTVNADNKKDTEVFGVSFAFDMRTA